MNNQQRHHSQASNSQMESNMFLQNISSVNQTTMSSREIAELTGKRHDHVKRDVEVMFKELGIDAPKFGVIYLDSMNRQRIEYILNQELIFTLVTGYSIKLRNAVIKRWLYLEQHTASLQQELNKWCAKENCDRAIGSMHGKGLAERKKTKRLNEATIGSIIKQMQLKLDI